MPTYDRISKLLHWIVGLAVLAQFGLGCWMLDIPKDGSGARAWWFNLHKSIGLSLLAFVVIRLLWRVTHPAPLPPGALPRAQRLAASLTHWALYACMLLMPLSGYLGSSFTAYPIRYFGVALPHWGWDWPAAKAAMSALHAATAWALGVLVALHIAAAFWHLLRRDGLFARMWPA
jgi:cytochrome b561